MGQGGRSSTEAPIPIQRAPQPDADTTYASAVLPPFDHAQAAGEYNFDPNIDDFLAQAWKFQKEAHEYDEYLKAKEAKQAKQAQQAQQPQPPKQGVAANQVRMKPSIPGEDEKVS